MRIQGESSATDRELTAARTSLNLQLERLSTHPGAPAGELSLNALDPTGVEAPDLEELLADLDRQLAVEAAEGAVEIAWMIVLARDNAHYSKTELEQARSDLLVAQNNLAEVRRAEESSLRSAHNLAQAAKLSYENALSALATSARNWR